MSIFVVGLSYFSDPHKASLVQVSFQFQISCPPSEFFSVIYDNLVPQNTSSSSTNESMLSNSGLPNTHSLSAQCRYCSVTAVQWGVASVCRRCIIFCRLVYFISFPSPLHPSLTHPSHAACVRAGPGLRTLRAAQFQSSLRERGM